MSQTPLGDQKALADLKVAISNLSAYHKLDMASFVYGFLLGKGCSDELACYESDKYSE